MVVVVLEAEEVTAGQDDRFLVRTLDDRTRPEAPLLSERCNLIRTTVSQGLGEGKVLSGGSDSLLTSRAGFGTRGGSGRRGSFGSEKVSIVAGGRVCLAETTPSRLASTLRLLSDKQVGREHGDFEAITPMRRLNPMSID